MMTKRIYIILLMLCMALGAKAQEATADDDCMPPLEKLSAQEQSSWRDFLDVVCNDWKKLGSTGHNPALTFKDISTDRIVVGAEYNLDDSAAMRAAQQYDWTRVMALYDATKRMSHIFDAVAKLGCHVVLHVTLQPGGTTQIYAYNNATLRRVLSMEQPASAAIYADAVERHKQVPFLFDDGVTCTGLSYCNHLWTIHLHSDEPPDAEYDPFIYCYSYCAEIVEGYDFMKYIGMDGTTARYIITAEGMTDTFAYEFTPAQLLGNEPTINVNLIGRQIAKNTYASLPMQIGDGTAEDCTYDQELKTLVFAILTDELTILNNQGREEQNKILILNALMLNPEQKEFIEGMAELGLGIEFRIQSRTTRRTSTISISADELRNYLIERQ
ncbi:MAG: hypothetical protein IKR33_06260 [Bacteroidales bacterium]|nr:hypothetical protein [Bacteroidales bacterium]